MLLYGVFPMQEPDAVGLHHPPHGQRLWRDALHRPGSTTAKSSTLFDRNFPGTSEGIEGLLRASNRGLEYRREFVVPSTVLDEDKDGTDEVFVRARFVDGDCVSRVQNTNVVKGNF